MPSLQELEQFKSSFTSIGDEQATLAELELPQDDFPLPNEALAATPDFYDLSDSSTTSDIHDPTDFLDSLTGNFEEPTRAPEPAGADVESDIFDSLDDLLGGMGDPSAGTISSVGDIEEPALGGQEDLDFNEFIDSIPDDFQAQEPAAADESDELENDFGAAELLKGFGDEMIDQPPTDDEALAFDMEDTAGNNATDESDAEFAAESTEDSATGDDYGFGDMGFDTMPDFGDSESPDAFVGEDPSFDMGEAADAESGFDMGETPAFDMEDSAGNSVADESAEFAAEPVGDSATDDYGFGDMGFDDLPDFGDSESPDAFVGEDPSFDMGGAADADSGFDMGETPAFDMEDSAGNSVADESAAEFASEAAGDSATDDYGFGDMGFDDLPDFGDSESPDAFAGEDLSFDMEDSAENTVADESAADSAYDDYGFGEMELGNIEETAMDDPSMEFSDDDNFGIGGESSDFDNSAVLEEIPGDSFDNFKMDSSAVEDFPLGSEDVGAFGDDFGNLDDFALDGIGSVFDGKSASASGVSTGAASAKAARTAAKEPDDVEEIRLTNDELEKFQATLSLYPLNLRIACQELIVEHAVDPAKMSRLVKMLIAGAPVKETAALASKILDRPIPIPKGFEKKTGEALEAEQSSFGYIFVHNFLPVLRLFIVIALVGLSLVYLGWRFIYNPIRADRIYRYGLERIAAGEFARANERFREAFRIHQRASWFYEYARAFIEARQFTLAEQKYLELLHFTASRNRRGIPDREAVLEYAHMVSAILGHYERADRILRQHLLDWNPLDREGLLALGDNAMAWGEIDPERFEDAREAYARIIERHGRSDLMLERMLMYFIRTDNLGEVLALQAHFMASARRIISAETLAEMGGYFLDKRLEEVRGVPNPFLQHIGGIREILIRAIRQNPMLPESYYHLARYYNYFNNLHYERLTLEAALWVFDAAPEGNPRRIRYHINALRRYSEILIRNREFFRAGEYLERGIGIYENALARRLLTPAPEFGMLYANIGDLEYFVREGNMQAALEYYRMAERHGWAPPEIQFRMGGAYYQLGQWGPALERLLAAHREVPLNRRVLFALGNASFMRGNYFSAQGFYDQLLEMLYADRDRLPAIWPSDDERQMELVERIMVAQNNLGATLEALTERTGDNSFRNRAHGLYSDSARAWDILTRNPETMIRMRPSPDIIAPGVNPAYLNIRNSLHPIPGQEPLFFGRIDRDLFEISDWDILAPPGYRLSAGVGLAR